MKEKLNKIHIKIHELHSFLKAYINEGNVKYWLNILSNIETKIEYYRDKEISKNEIDNLAYLYKSMFFPRDVLGDFYVFNSNRETMKEKNDYLFDLIKELDKLLKIK